MIRLLLALFLLSIPPALAQPAPQPTTRPAARTNAPRTILFVGNSFTFGALSPVERYRAETVTDLNGTGYGGVPALFKAFTTAVGQDWRVSLETVPGAGLDLHWAQKRALIDRPWDVVTLQGFSTLDAAQPGDPTNHARHAALLADMAQRANPRVRVELVATWSRADQTWVPDGHWYGEPIERMAEDLQRASVATKRDTRAIDGVVPVGLAWNRAFDSGLADPDPYDELVEGIDLWASDHYHASTAGYYLHALMIFGKVTGIDPRKLTRDERAGIELGLSPDQIAALQTVAHRTLLRHGRAR